MRQVSYIFAISIIAHFFRAAIFLFTWNVNVTKVFEVGQATLLQTLICSLVFGYVCHGSSVAPVICIYSRDNPTLSERMDHATMMGLSDVFMLIYISAFIHVAVWLFI